MKPCAVLAVALSAPLLVASLLAQAKPAQPPASAPSAQAKFVPPARGLVELGHLAPATKRAKDMVISTIRVKNITNAPIAGLRIEEFWWDKAGNPVSGGRVGPMRKPLQPGEVATLTIESPYNAKMDRNNFVFSHANGKIKPRLLKNLD